MGKKRKSGSLYLCEWILSARENGGRQAVADGGRKLSSYLVLTLVKHVGHVIFSCAQVRKGLLQSSLFPNKGRGEEEKIRVTLPL